MRHLTAFIEPVPELLAREAGDGKAEADFFIECALEEWEPCERGGAVSHYQYFHAKWIANITAAT